MQQISYYGFVYIYFRLNLFIIAIPYKYRSLLFAIKRLYGPIKYGLVISLAILINYECRLWNLPNGFENLIGLNHVIIQILYAFVTGFIFYFIIDHLSMEKKRVSILRLLNNCVHQIHEISSNIIEETCKVSGQIKETQKVTFQKFCSLCDHVSIHNAKFTIWYIGRLSCKDSVLKSIALIKRNVDEIIIFYDLLDEEWTASLSSILDNIKRIELHLDLNGSISTLNMVASPIWNNFIEANNLIRLRNDYDKKYYQQNKNKFPPGKTYVPNETTFLITVEKKIK